MITLYFYKILHNYLNKWHIIYVNQLNDQEKKKLKPIYDGTYTFSETMEIYCIEILPRWVKLFSEEWKSLYSMINIVLGLDLGNSA